jgi:Family of unknown function (DUF5906)
MKITSLNDIKTLRDYFDRIGAQPRSLRTAVVSENSGIYWKDIAVIRISQNGEIKAPDGYEPTADETQKIIAECQTVEWPRMVHIEVKNERIDLPPELKNWPKDQLFFFRSLDDKLVMIQQRTVRADGSKHYIPWTFWDDQQWRRAEPEGSLPIYGLEKISNRSIVFVHEGAKSAVAIEKLLADPDAYHPWKEELAIGAHLGWIGGALNPARTDWSVLNDLSMVIIVADNDESGINAVSQIAYHLRVPTYCIRFTQAWPPSSDLGDPFPAQFFHKDDSGTKHYIGPKMRTLLEPATWATDSVPLGKKTVYVLRDEFASQWAYIQNIELFVNMHNPQIMYTEPAFNKAMASFSHVENTAKLLYKTYSSVFRAIGYRPDTEKRIVDLPRLGCRGINVHVAGDVRPMAGDPTPWLEFMKYLIPDDRERLETLRWIATMVSRPAVRIEYGLMLISENQGIGKTTLASHILAPLVGYSNVSHPTEEDLLSPFNGWVAAKRLVCIGEIYQGRSWKAYHRLKSIMTDAMIDVNEKYIKPYTIDNYAQFVACSNSPNALKLEDEDRRWFYPTITEKAWTQKQFTKFYNWLKEESGLAIIRQWTEDWSEGYILPGTKAPMTEAKKNAINASRSEAVQIFLDGLGLMNELEVKRVIYSQDIMAWAKLQFKDKLFDTFQTFKKAAATIGWVTYDERITINKKQQWVIMSPLISSYVDEHYGWPSINGQPVDRKAVRAFLTDPTNLDKVSDYTPF